MSASRLTPTIAISGHVEAAGREIDHDRDEVAGGGEHDHGDGRRGRHDERRADDDEREREEERARGPAGEQHDERHEDDRDDAFDDVLRPAERAGRQQVVGDQDEQAGDAEDGEDRALPVRPQPARGHEDPGGEDPGPAGDPDHAVVRRHRDAVGDARVTVERGHAPVVERGERRVRAGRPRSRRDRRWKSSAARAARSATVHDPHRDHAQHKAGVGHDAP